MATTAPAVVSFRATMKARSEHDRARLASAIRAAEVGHRGEIVVHVERRSLQHPLRRAARLFTALGVGRTRDGTGALLYVATAARRLAVWAGSGVTDGDQAETWAPVFAAVRGGPLDVDRLCAAIAALGQVLMTRAAGVDRHGNELDEVVRS